MGCLTVRTTRIGGMNAAVRSSAGLSVRAPRCGTGIKPTARRIGGITEVESRLMNDLRIVVSLVCSVSTKEYLRVKPDEILWIEVGANITYRIISNTEWILE